MKIVKLACLVSLLATGVAESQPACDGFQIKIKNNLPDTLLTTKIELTGAEVQPSGIKKLDSNSEITFLITGSNQESAMVGEFIFHTISLPSKAVRIKFNLNNVLLVCEHTKTPAVSDYSVESSRLPGLVTYSISN